MKEKDFHPWEKKELATLTLENIGSSPHLKQGLKVWYHYIVS